MRRPEAGAVLTARETDVLRLVATGHSNKQIAVHLGIGEATVKTHLLKAFDKLGRGRPHARRHDRTGARTSRPRSTLSPVDGFMWGAVLSSLVLIAAGGWCGGSPERARGH